MHAIANPNHRQISADWFFMDEVDLSIEVLEGEQDAVSFIRGESGIYIPDSET